MNSIEKKPDEQWIPFVFFVIIIVGFKLASYISDDNVGQYVLYSIFSIASILGIILHVVLLPTPFLNQNFVNKHYFGINITICIISLMATAAHYLGFF